MLTYEQRRALKREIDRRRREQLGIIEAGYLLRDALGAGPRDASDVIRELQAAGFGLVPIRKALTRLRVDGRSPVWALPAGGDDHEDFA